MNFKDQIIRLTENAGNYLVHFAKTTKEEKLDWKPLDSGRSALDQLQECAETPLLFAAVLQTGGFPEMSPEAAEAAKAEKASWTTVDQCAEKMSENNKVLFDAIRNYPNEDMSNEMTMPWGEVATAADVMTYQYWNLVYHQGQINYIQTLYGDHEMFA
jgi:hypothetical protein